MYMMCAIRCISYLRWTATYRRAGAQATLLDSTQTPVRKITKTKKNPPLNLGIGVKQNTHYDYPIF